MADKLETYPKGFVKNVLVHIKIFYFPIDFIVIDTALVKISYLCIPTIVKHSFLVTTHVMINCRNGVMKLSFGNMILELNVFSVCKQLIDNDKLQDINCIEKILEERDMYHCSSPIF